MPLKLVRILAALFLAALFLGLLAACSPSGLATPQAEPGTYPVDTVFREFYQMLGGKDRLGPAISPLFDYQDKRCQYAYNALMCYNPLAKDIDRFSLFPLGNFLGVKEDPAQAETGSSASVDGYPIYEEFLPVYDSLHGALYVGRPLTAARTNYLQNRIEQYFENMGFYRSLDDPTGEIRLLAYGGFLCDLDCRYKPGSNPGAIIRSDNDTVDQPFLTSLVRMGGLSVFGQPLTEPYVAADGNVEQVYENVVLYSPAGNYEMVDLRPAPLLLSMPTTPPGPDVPARGMVFYPVSDGLGYSVPELFDQFIASHGGREISGNPISSLWQVGDSLFRQCFENYCLDYDHTSPEPLRVRMTTLGPLYLEQTQLDPSLVVRFVYSPDTVNLAVSEGQPSVSTTGEQSISIQVNRKQDGQPVTNVEALILLRLPNGQETAARFSPTDANGYASVVLPPMNLKNGSVVGYQVCLNVPSEESICSNGNYLVIDLP